MSDLFTTKAPLVMHSLIADFDLTAEDAAAILGSIGHETGGFKFMQELHPLEGGRGGYGWCQWTGPRRVAFEEYCRRNAYDPASDFANYKWLFIELSGDYKSAIPALKLAGDLDAKVATFERSFEKAGVPAYASRQKWARAALQAYRLGPVPIPPGPLQHPPQPPPQPGSSKTQNAAAAAIMGGLVAGFLYLLRKLG